MTINVLGPLHVVSRPEDILTTHCRKMLQMVQKVVQKWPKNRHFWTHSAFFSAMASWKGLIFMSINALSLLKLVSGSKAILTTHCREKL